MPTPNHLRWYAVLAIGGALLLGWLNWPMALFLLGMLAAERLATTAGSRAYRARRPADPSLIQTTVLPAPRPPRAPIRLRLPSEVTRALDADCPACQGFGCETCAYTGLF